MKRIIKISIFMILITAVSVSSVEITENDIEFKFISGDEIGLYQLVLPE